MNSHDRDLINARSLDLHRLAADKIRRHPHLIDTVVEHLEMWKACGSRAGNIVNQWLEIIRNNMDEALEIAVEESERADHMRAHSPFIRVLTPSEKAGFARAVRPCKGP